MSNYHIPFFTKNRRLNLKDIELITLVAAAKELNFCPNIIRKFINKYRLRAYKLGGKWYLDKKQVALLKKLFREFPP
jgi:hypothetical protein